jgi:hypothetical protein
VFSAIGWFRYPDFCCPPFRPPYGFLSLLGAMPCDGGSVPVLGTTPLMPFRMLAGSVPATPLLLGSRND